MEQMTSKHWFNDHKEYWGGFLLIVLAQAVLTLNQFQVPWHPVIAFLLFAVAFTLLNFLVAVIILLLTWPVRRNFHFSRFIKILVAFSAVYFISQLISFLVLYFKG